MYWIHASKTFSLDLERSSFSFLDSVSGMDLSGNIESSVYSKSDIFFAGASADGSSVAGNIVGDIGWAAIRRPDSTIISVAGKVVDLP